MIIENDLGVPLKKLELEYTVLLCKNSFAKMT